MKMKMSEICRFADAQPFQSVPSAALRLVVGAALWCAAGWSAACVSAAESPDRANGRVQSGAVVAAVDPMQEVTPEREAAAETFARLHHPELAELLSRLKVADPQAYENAIRDLFRESERLAKLKGRDAARYDLELQAWRLSSRIHLATARLAMTDSDGLRAELAELVSEKLAIQQRVLQLERSKLAARLQKLDAELQSLEASRESHVEQEVDRLLKSARARMTTSGPRSQRPAGGSPAFGAGQPTKAVNAPAAGSRSPPSATDRSASDRSDPERSRRSGDDAPIEHGAGDRRAPSPAARPTPSPQPQP